MFAAALIVVPYLMRARLATKFLREKICCRETRINSNASNFLNRIITHKAAVRTLLRTNIYESGRICTSICYALHTGTHVAERKQSGATLREKIFLLSGDIEDTHKIFQYNCVFRQPRSKRGE